MKKHFTIEIEYQEKNNEGGDVLYEGSLENMLEQWMEGFISTNSIEKEFKLAVRDHSEYYRIVDAWNEIGTTPLYVGNGDLYKMNGNTVIPLPDSE